MFLIYGVHIDRPPLIVPVLRAALGMLDAALTLLDPMLATGGSLEHACRVIKDCGAGSITAVCVASVDHGLNDVAFIVPGLGDAGDRQFGEP